MPWPTTRPVHMRILFWASVDSPQICEFYQLVDEATMSNDSAWQAAAQQQLRAFSNWALLFFQEGERGWKGGREG